MVDTKVVTEPFEPLFELGPEVIRLPDPDDEDDDDDDDDRPELLSDDVEDAEVEEPEDEDDPLA